jgi:hypothetical protein
LEVREFSELRGWPAPAAQFQVQLTAADGAKKSTVLLFMNSGEGWKIVVTRSVIDKYAAQLQEPVAAGK